MVGGCDIGHRRHWNGQDAMGTADTSGPFMEYRDHHVPDPQVVQAHGCRRNVHNGIHRSHFVEMDFFQGSTMGFGFRFSQDGKDLHRQGMGPFRQFSLGQDVQHFPEPPVGMMVMMGMGFGATLLVLMVMSMMMSMVPVLVAFSFRGFRCCLVFGKAVEIVHIVVVVFVLCIQPHQEVTAVQAGLLYPADFHRISGQGQGGQGLPEHLFIRTQIQQGPYGHIPADAAFAFQIEHFFHTVTVPFRRPAG